MGNTYDDEQWKKRLKELIAYKKIHGDCRVPVQNKRYVKLGNWVSKQRQEYKRWLKRKSSSTLTQEKFDLLDDLGFDWIIDIESGPILKKSNVGKTLEEQWMQKFNELVKYRKKHGDCLVPRRYKQNNVLLGNWVSKQRKEYKIVQKGGHSTLTQERIDLLDDLDFAWIIEYKKIGDKCDRFKILEDMWKQKFKEMKVYRKKHGDCLVPRRYEQNNVKLGYWAKHQRTEYKKWIKGEYTSFTQEKVDLLEGIDFAWEAKFGRPSKESNKSTQESSISSVDHRNVASTKTKSNRPRRTRTPSKDRPKKRVRRQKFKTLGRELSKSEERKERRRLMVQALKSWRNPMRPVEEFLSDDW